MSIHGPPREILTENREAVDRINQRMGYRLQPLEVSSPKTVEIGKASFKVNWTWANKGVAPCYPGGFPCLTLKDAEGGIVSVLTDESLDMRRLKVGPPGGAPVTALTSGFTIGGIAPTTRPGTYELFISVGLRDGTPRIALPLAADDGQRVFHQFLYQFHFPITMFQTFITLATSGRTPPGHVADAPVHGAALHSCRQRMPAPPRCMSVAQE